MALHCPVCMAVILSRRNKLCSVCQGPLPTEFLLAPDEQAGIEGADSLSPTPVAASQLAGHDMASPTGLKPTLRHMMIVVLWAALMLTSLRMMMGLGLLAAPPEVICMTVGIVVATWPAMLLCVLLICLDRKGPVRSWYFSCCAAGGGLLAGASYLFTDPVCFALSGRWTLSFPLFPPIGLLCLWGNVKYLRSVWPRRCPCCGRRAVILVGSALPGTIRDWRNKVWCAACGRAYEKEGSTAWLPKSEGVDGFPFDPGTDGR